MLSNVLSHYLKNPVIPVTPEKIEVLQPQPAPVVAVTPVTPVTPEKTQTQPQPQNTLLAADRSKLLDYMAAIDEREPEMINELLEECAKKPAALSWALNWADKILAAQDRPEQSLITCRSCDHFNCFNTHGGGTGTCGAGVQPWGNCWWSETRHDCGKYQVSRLKNGQ